MIQTLPMLAALLLAAPPASRCDVLVIGDTPCGIAAALAAARLNRSVAMVGDGRHVGGMMSSGLSITDVRLPNAHGGIFREFTAAVESWYAQRYGADSPQVADCNGGLWFEPHVAERIFDRMLAAQSGIVLYRDCRLVQAVMDGDRTAGAVIERRQGGRRETLLAAVVIDADYEGDFAAAAGVPYRVGRESREEHWEPYAGRVFLKNPGLQLLPGSSGEGDHRVQAYNYRLFRSGDRIAGVVVEHKSGRQEIHAAVTIDASGDGDVAARGGAAWEKGRQGDGLVQSRRHVVP